MDHSAKIDKVLYLSIKVNLLTSLFEIWWKIILLIKFYMGSHTLFF